MLVELEVRDFAIIEHLRLRLGDGFNVLTGETGAGKSIIIGAVGQLLGERANADTVRAGAKRAIVEGVFEPGGAADAIREVLEEYGIDEDPVLIMSREIHAAGRSTARVNGRAVPVRALAEIGRCLIDVHGQSENVSLKRESTHIELLDRFAGLEKNRLALGERVRHRRSLQSELEALQRDERELARRAGLLSFQVEEIHDAGLSQDEESTLLAERARLAGGERLMDRMERAYDALRGDDETDQPEKGALDQLDIALAALDEVVAIDPALADARDALAGAMESAADAARAVRSAQESFDFSAERLEEVEERLVAYSDLKRKYGPEVSDVLAFGARAGDELAAIVGADARIESLGDEIERTGTDIGRLAGVLSAARQKAGRKLSKAVVKQLESLGMEGSRFETSFARREDPAGVPIDGALYHVDETGVEHVAFLVSANAGEPPKPLAQTASGGETARIMLGLKSILTAADKVPTLIFDEIDAGIGGRIGDVVGRKLWALAEGHQVLCVTHLPQVAVFGDRHAHVRKSVVDGRTATIVENLDEAGRVGEVALMLGGEGETVRRNALHLIEGSHRWKAEARGEKIADKVAG